MEALCPGQCALTSLPQQDCGGGGARRGQRCFWSEQCSGPTKPERGLSEHRASQSTARQDPAAWELWIVLPDFWADWGFQSLLGW